MDIRVSKTSFDASAQELVETGKTDIALYRYHGGKTVIYVIYNSEFDKLIPRLFLHSCMPMGIFHIGQATLHCWEIDASANETIKILKESYNRILMLEAA